MIWLVPTHQVERVWPDVEGLLRPVIDLPACRSTLSGTLRALRCGARQLFVAIEENTIVAAAVTQITTYDIGDWLTVVLCGGRGLNEWGEEGMQAIEEWSEKCGCQNVEIWGRDGWAKALGYEKTGAMIQRTVN